MFASDAADNVIDYRIWKFLKIVLYIFFSPTALTRLDDVFGGFQSLAWGAGKRGGVRAPVYSTFGGLAARGAGAGAGSGVVGALDRLDKSEM